VEIPIQDPLVIFGVGDVEKQKLMAGFPQGRKKALQTTL
jgi:hypothetical protein